MSIKLYTLIEIFQIKFTLKCEAFNLKYLYQCKQLYAHSCIFYHTAQKKCLQNIIVCALDLLISRRIVVSPYNLIKPENKRLIKRLSALQNGRLLSPKLNYLVGKTFSRDLFCHAKHLTRLLRNPSIHRRYVYRQQFSYLLHRVAGLVETNGFKSHRSRMNHLLLISEAY